MAASWKLSWQKQALLDSIIQCAGHLWPIALTQSFFARITSTLYTIKPCIWLTYTKRVNKNRAAVRRRSTHQNQRVAPRAHAPLKLVRVVLLWVLLWTKRRIICPFPFDGCTLWNGGVTFDLHDIVLHLESNWKKSASRKTYVRPFGWEIFLIAHKRPLREHRVQIKSINTCAHKREALVALVQKKENSSWPRWVQNAENSSLRYINCSSGNNRGKFSPKSDSEHAFFSFPRSLYIFDISLGLSVVECVFRILTQGGLAQSVQFRPRP